MTHTGMDDRGRTTSKAGILLGIGLGGFVDGIALHQIAQWHNMGSAVLPPTTMEAMRQNMAWDGWFHVATLVLTTIGVYWLLRDARAGVGLPTARAFTGLLLLGWGLFNLVEGVVNHHLLGLHHVRDMPVHMPLYDWLFLGLGGIGLVVSGWLLSRAPEGTTSVPPVSQTPIHVHDRGPAQSPAPPR